MNRIGWSVRTVALAGVICWLGTGEAWSARPGRKTSERKPEAVKQNKQEQPAAPAAPAPMPEPAGPKVVVIDEAQAREWESLIELDLLADPVTFPHSIRCLAGEQGMEVRGYVPNNLVRDRALSIAQKASPMQVVSGMVIQPNLYYGHPGKLSLEEVHERLAKLQTRHPKVIEVQLGPTGQVVLTGSVASLEDKLLVGRTLRTVTGCTSVRNELGVVHGTVQLPTVAAVTARTFDAPKPGMPPMPTPQTLSTAKAPPSVDAKSTQSTERTDPLLPPTRAPEVIRDNRSGTAGMPPAPVAPAKQADYRPADGKPATVAGIEDVGSPVAQASKVASPAAAQSAVAQPAVAQRPADAGGEAKPAPQHTLQLTLSARGQQSVKNRIKGALGAAIRDVDLKFDGKGGVKVILAIVGQSPDTDRIAQTVVTVPELQNFDVSMEFRLD
jgi:hypothetical protein